jgi:gluconolactonase
MNRRIAAALLLAVCLGAGCYRCPEIASSPLIREEAALQRLGGGFQFTEGPAADRDGNVFFTDISASRIHRWSTRREISIFLENSRRTNGLAFAPDGLLIGCAGGSGEIIAIDPKGNITVLASEYDGKPFNSPNDLWIRPDGGIYFTDPRYGSRENLPQDGEHVYFLTPDRSQVIRVIDDMVRPNGLVGTPDGRTLYVADHGAGRTWSYTIRPDGTLADKSLFVPQGSDGMTIDELGNIYLTDVGVSIYSPQGLLLGTIETPETPSNLTFGGSGGRMLFITARSSVYGQPMNMRGARQ